MNKKGAGPRDPLLFYYGRKRKKAGPVFPPGRPDPERILGGTRVAARGPSPDGETSVAGVSDGAPVFWGTPRPEGRFFRRKPERRPPTGCPSGIFYSS